MNRSKKTNGLLLTLCIISVFIFAGCGEEKSGNTISEPEITGKYLKEEYSQQLLTDGAETMIGTVDIEKKDDNYKVTVTEKEVVPNSSYNEGYYISDTNLVTDLTLGLDARIASLEDGKLVVESADEFIKSKAEHKDQLFTVYMMGTSAELIIGTDPADVMID